MTTIKKRLYEIIFESDTRAGKIFDETLLGIILFSIVVVMLESVTSIRIKYAQPLKIIEWTITVIFTIEYLLRIWVVGKPIRYMLSFYGLIDLCTLLPSYVGFFVGGAQSMLAFRVLRLLRIFRILKMSNYTRASRTITTAIWNSKEKLGVFTLVVLTLSVVIGTIMYLIEGEQHGFTSIPTSIYWAIVTLTTVGYGDLSPVTGAGKFFASLVMILGYAIIAVPTGIVTASLMGQASRNSQVCPSCMLDKHEDDALYCKRCGTSLDKKT